MEDHERCRRFFCQPSQTLQRHYEILRAHFVEERSLQDIADAHGMNYYSVRDLVRRFRDQCRQGQASPFLSSRPWDDLA